jgi:hypothetical protein
VERALSISQEQGQSLPVSSPASSSHVGDGHNHIVAPILGVLSTLTEELRGLGSVIASAQRYEDQQPVERLDDNATQRKRQRTSGLVTNAIGETRSVKDPIADCHDDILTLWDEIIDAYFRFVNPWISILHEPSIRKGLLIARKNANLPLIFQAMVVSALRFVAKDNKNMSNNFHIEHTSKARREILVSSTDEMSLESVQALLILTYTELADDNTHKASSLLGMVARYVEHLQLAVENLTRGRHAGVFGRSRGPVDAMDWIEEEERKRVFWNFTMLDRLCMALLGCSTTFSGVRVRRKLPACASFWGTNRPRPTPYLCLVDALSPTFTPDMSPEGLPDEDGNDGELLSSGIGALAFYIETVESMGMIEVYFLRQRVDCNSSNDVARWLTRFKELDAYLMRYVGHSILLPHLHIQLFLTQPPDGSRAFPSSGEIRAFLARYCQA